jgi:NIMA (never in mitosis gene a)-related kinase
MAAAAPPPPRSRASDFVWGRKLGQGSFGAAFEVVRTINDRTYVIKQCFIGRMSQAEQDDAIHEVHLLASLSHEYIVKYHDSFIAPGALNIVMEHCPGGDLAALIQGCTRCGNRLAEATIWRYTLQLCSALSFIHLKKILHRDLKAANVFLGRNGDIRLGDFGVSKVLEKTSDLAKTRVGTPYFMSPELCRSQAYSAKSDIWALGCLVYELCALRPPFQAGNLASLVLAIIKCVAPPPTIGPSPLPAAVGGCGRSI